jgi:hypothetical protein
MPRYLSQHTLACLTRQGAEELSKKILGAKSVTGRRVLVNMQEGKMLAEFDASSREEMEKWLTAEKFHSIGSFASNTNPLPTPPCDPFREPGAQKRSNCHPCHSGVALTLMNLRVQTCTHCCCLCCTEVCSGAGG